LASLAPAQSQEPVFRADVNLQSIAVQVTDKQGHDVRGLSAGDFIVLEDGRPQKIAFFGAEHQPISLLVLLDSSSSMRSSSKLAGAWTLLGPLTHANLPEDEIFLAPFTDLVGALERLSGDRRANPPAVDAASMGGGTALYDALASGLCHMRSATNVRQAVVAITDGSDQHSRLRLEQLIQLAQASKPQIFMIGFFDPFEYESYRKSGKTVTLVSGREIDNPVHLFDRVAKETGAESFFPKSDRDLQQVIDHILGILQAQYTIAYYPRDIGKFRRIQVKVNRGGVIVAARRSAGSEGTEGEPVHFSANSCEVSPADHPYPWEPHVTEGPSHAMIYRDDFSDARSGWPNHPGSRYVPGGYELHLALSAPATGDATRTSGGRMDPRTLVTPSEAERRGQGGLGDKILAAYGPWWRNFRASVSIEGSGDAARGMVFRLGATGCYVLLLSGTEKATGISFKLVKQVFWNDSEVPMIPWTHITGPALAAFTSAKTENRIAVECRGDRITILLNGAQVTATDDPSFANGYVGMAQFGSGRTLFHDLRVEGLP
jgi:Ca-activated chloride channel family protein